MTNYGWDDNEFPLGYLITIRTFGTWLHGDERNSVDRHGRNIYGTPRIGADAKFLVRMKENIAGPALILNEAQRHVVEEAIRNVCRIRNLDLHVVNVRTNHAHCVVSAKDRPESIMNAFKANATRELREARLIDDNVKVWSRGGSRKYLWKDNDLDSAIAYVRYEQGM